jgi:hypothetical protein
MLLLANLATSRCALQGSLHQWTKVVQSAPPCRCITFDATAILPAFPVRFPLIHRALLRVRGGGVAPASLSDFSLLALVPAVQAARQQDWGLEMMRAALTRTAATADGPGTVAVQAFADHTSDLNAAQAIKHGRVTVEVFPLDV